MNTNQGSRCVEASGPWSPTGYDLSSSSVVAVIVAYHPPSDFQEKILRISSICKQTIIIDNTLGIPDPHFLELTQVDDRIRYFSFGRNEGISAALNRGVKMAIELHAGWVLLLDQDSELPENFLADVSKALQSFPCLERVGILCPSLSPPVKEEPICNPVLTAITSGSLIQTRIFQEVGWFNEDLFIDYVDFDFCLRARAKGWLTLMATNVYLTHRIGCPINFSTPFGTLRTLNHPSIRRYYKFRNRIHMGRLYFFKHPAWIIKEFLSGILEIVKIGLLEPDKSNKFAMIFKGTIDGLIGKIGPAPLSVAKEKERC